MSSKKIKTFKYTQCFKQHEIELTWDFFINGVEGSLEFFFNYNDLSIDVAFHFEGEKKIYELNINGGSTPQYLLFDSVDELINHKAFDGKSLYEIWDELET